MLVTVGPELINTPLGELYVLLAYDQRGIPWYYSLTNVRYVRNIMSEVPKENEDSAAPATVRYLFDLNANVEFLQKKCAKCKINTPHSWFKVGVTDIGDPENPVDPLELLKLYKRVVLCQNCGNISVTN